MIDLSTYRKRRERFYAQFEGGAAIIPAASLVTHHADCEHRFRQDSDFWYLTGFDEPDAVALLLPFRPEGERFVLFVQPEDPSLEIWHGSRFGIEGAVREFGADVAHPIEEFSGRIGNYLEGCESIAFRVGRHPKYEDIVLGAWAAQLDLSARRGGAASSLVAPCPLLHQLRLRKEPEELERMRLAARISAEAHELAREAIRPGMNERDVQALIEKHFLEQGARGPAYGSIVAAGENACILHYTANNAPLNAGDLLLIDAGCSLEDYYNADITRTFPVDGSFSSEQRVLYEIVFAAQKAAISSVYPGNNADGVHQAALRVLVEGLLGLGLLVGDIDEVIERGLYRHLYMHRTGHWLGLDVHDVGAYRLGEQPKNLEPGMVLTVEPGLYISDRLPIPEGQPEIDDCWKGIGIRIEDDVLVTEKGAEVFTNAAVSSLEQIEKK